MTREPEPRAHAAPAHDGEGPGVHSANFRFPPGFLWGAATSAHQVEGNCTNNDWWAWEQSGKVREPSGLACDHYRRFREDFDLARELHHNAHRFSLEWSRIEPKEGQFSDEAIAHYRDVLRARVRAYRAIHAVQPEAMVSVTQHALALSPCNPRSVRDRLSVRIRGYIINHLFLSALHTGAVRAPGVFWERLPGRRTLDFIGLNYYTRDFVRNTGFTLPGFLGDFCPLEIHQYIGKRNSLGWEVFPEGLARFLDEYARYKLPILITENGVPEDRDEHRWT